MATNNKKKEHDASLAIGAKRLSELYSAGSYDLILDHAISWISDFSNIDIRQELRSDQRLALDNSLETLGYYLSRPDFNFNKAKYIKILQFHPLLTNLFAISSYGSSDFLVWHSLRLPKLNPWLPIFLNARNSYQFSRNAIFDINPHIASEWYGQYFMGVSGFQAQIPKNNLINHLQFWDHRMMMLPSISNGYMRSTYIDCRLDRLYKSRFNEFVKKSLVGIKINNRPKGNHIAVVTGRWSPINPTYKNRYVFFEELSKKYELTLVHVGPDRSDLEKGIFTNYENVKFRGNILEGKSLFNNNFDMVFYPDIGMNVESRFLCNLRLAPIQVTTNSHPVSTFGSEIDYFITGKDSELPIDQAQQHYSEKLILIPGIGTRPNVPTYKSKNSSVLLSEDPIRIACPWGALKFNYEMLKRLGAIKKQSRRNIVYVFLATLSPLGCSYLPFKKDLVEILGENSLEIYSSLPFDQYMEKLSGCSIALDPFPFGGNTSIIDCMNLGVPIVVQNGWQFYNLAGGFILDKMGVGDLATNTENEYIQKALSLVNDSTLVEKYRFAILQKNIRDILPKLGDPKAFSGVITELMANRKL